MNLNIIEDYELLEGGIDIISLEKLIYRFVNLLNIYEVSLPEGIDPLHNLICLKEHDGSKLSNNICKLILNWVESKYDNSLFGNFSGTYIGSDKKAKQLVKLMRSIEGLIIDVHCNIDVLPFLNRIVEESNSEYEIGKIEFLLERITRFSKLPSREKLPNEILDKVLFRADAYFEKEFESKEMTELFCGLRETVVEHELCYTISWCRKSDKYKPISGWTGAGPLMVSKISDKFELMGSSPGVDWIRLFELDIQGLEEYFYAEVVYKEECLFKLKNILQCSSEELLSKVNNEGRIVFTQSKMWCDYRPEFQNIIDALNDVGINCNVETRIRNKIEDN